MKKYLSDNRKNLFIIFTVIAILSSLVVFITFGMPKGHDLHFHLSRIDALATALKLNMFPIKVYPTYLNGYGYGNGLFYPDFFLLVPAFLRCCGLSITLSYKIFLVLINFFTVMSIYISVKGISKSHKAALIASIIYPFSSYHLVDLYTRAALGETLAFIFAPLVIYGIYELIYGDYKKYYILVIGMTGLLLSHVISTYLMGIVLVIICLVNIKHFFANKKRILYLVIAAIITALITSYFIFPMLEQSVKNEFLFSSLDITSDLVGRTMPLWAIFIELPYFISPWIPSGIGVIFCYLSYLFYHNRKRKIKNKNFLNLIMIIGILAVVFSTFLFPWRLLHIIMSPIQFPWRLFFVGTVLMTMAGSIFLDKYLHGRKKVKVIKLIIIISLVGLLINTVCTVFNSKYYYSAESYTVSYGEYLPKGSSYLDITTRGEKIISNNPIVFNFERKGLKLKINFSKNDYDDTTLELPLIYYDGYVAKISNGELDVYKTDDGLVGIRLNSFREGELVVYYKGTDITNITIYISIITAVVFFTYIFLKRKEKEHEKK